MASEPRRATLREVLKVPNNLGDALFQIVVLLMALIILALIGMLVYELYDGAKVGISTYGFGFLFQRDWDPIAEQFGSLPAIFGTVTSSLLALAIAGPLGLFVAIFLA